MRRSGPRAWAPPRGDLRLLGGTEPAAGERPFAPPLLRALRRRLAALWHGLRVLSGDAAWEQYVERCGGRPVLDRRAFYLERTQHKYRRPCRCC